MDKLLTRHQVLEITGISRPTLYSAIRAGLLPQPIKISKRCVRWKASELQAAIDAAQRTVTD
ncbi:MAG: AlpA family phage regulatory protein [Gammaproteobacteria bacterium]|nr:AlpA family phage regulatory protein [Gammaproteobacteria bacterium]MYG67922.1 AlpA family phage regulatory protein [Gammaproteobacteria bacterium]